MSQTKAQLIDTLVASLLPASDSAVDIGSNAVRFANIYGDTLYGSGANLTGLNIVTDTSPQLGGNLDVNTKNILFGDSASASDDRLIFGAGSDLSIYHDGVDNHIDASQTLSIKMGGETSAQFDVNGAVHLYYDNSKKFETTSTGAKISGTLLDINTTSANSAIVKLQTNVNTCEIEGRVVGGENHFILSSNNSADSLKITGAADGTVQLPNDNQKLRIGAGQDLDLFHDGTNSVIKNNTGTFFIAGDIVSLTNAAVSETYVKGTNNGAAELYFDNSKKFETTSTGANLYGHFLPDTTETHDLGSNAKKWSELHLKHYLYMPDSGRIRLGSSYNMQLFYDGSTQVLLGKTGDTVITCPSSQSVRLNKSSADNFLAESMLRAYADGAVELYYDNSKRFETSADGCIFSGPTNTTASIQIKGTEARSAEIRLIADDGDDFTDTVRLHQSINGNFYLQNLTASATFESMLVAAPNGAVELYYDNSKKLETRANGVEILDHLSLGDNLQVRLGNVGSGGDLRIYHDSNDSYIDDAGVGSLLLRTTTNSTVRIQNSSADMAVFSAGAQAELYHAGSKKLETTSAGATVTGTLVADNTAGRNMIINGDMRVAQRATSASLSNHGATIDVCDRWICNRHGVTIDVAQVAEAPDASGFKYSFKFTTTSAVSGSLAAGNMFAFNYKIERQDVVRLGYGTSDAKTATISFWVRGSLSGKVGVSCSRDSKIFSASEDIVANTWKFVEIVIPADTSTAISGTDNHNGFSISIVAGAGSNFTSGSTGGNWISFHTAYTAGMTAGQQGAYLTTQGSTFQITGVQFELGSKSTPFEHKHFGEQLLKCQRYYQEVLFNEQNTGGGILRASNSNNFQQPASIQQFVEMRAAASGAVITSNSLVYCRRLNGSSSDITASVSHAGGTTHGFINIRLTGTSSGTFTNEEPYVWWCRESDGQIMLSQDAEL